MKWYAIIIYKQVKIESKNLLHFYKGGFIKVFSKSLKNYMFFLVHNKDASTLIKC